MPVSYKHLQERPLLLVAERLLHATEYWKKCGWLESGLERGWVLRACLLYTSFL